MAATAGEESVADCGSVFVVVVFAVFILSLRYPW